MANSTKNNQSLASVRDRHSANPLENGVHEVKGMVEDVLLAVNDFASRNEERFNQIDDRFAKVDDRFAKVDDHFAKIEREMATKQDLADLELRIVTVDKMELMESRLATRFVTKSYLDAKLADQTSEIFLRLDRRQNKDRSFKENLVGVISGHSLITPKESDKLKELI